MDDIAAVDSAPEFLSESLQGYGGIPGTGLDFYGINSVFCFAVVGDNEVNFNVALFKVCFSKGLFIIQKCDYAHGHTSNSMMRYILIMRKQETARNFDNAQI